MKEYKQQNEFGYMRYVATPPSIWERLSWWFQSMLERIFMNPNTPWLVRIMYYGILMLIVGAAIWYIVRLRYGRALLPNSNSYRVGVDQIKNIEVEDFDSLIHDAVKENKFSLAIRYEYLKALSFLARNELIKLKESKSPLDYERELSVELSKDYKELAKLFEYVWYGEFEAGEKEYKEGNALSNLLEQKL